MQQNYTSSASTALIVKAWISNASEEEEEEEEEEENDLDEERGEQGRGEEPGGEGIRAGRAKRTKISTTKM